MKVFMKGALAKAAPPAAAFSYKLCDERHICVSGHVGSNSQDIQYEDASLMEQRGVPGRVQARAKAQQAQEEEVVETERSRACHRPRSWAGPRLLLQCRWRRALEDVSAMLVVQQVVLSLPSLPRSAPSYRETRCPELAQSSKNEIQR